MTSSTTAGAILTDDPLQIIMELCYSSLLGQLHDDEDTMMKTAEQRVKACIDIAKGGTYLATRLFVHRDLACRNIVVKRHSSPPTPSPDRPADSGASAGAGAGGSAATVGAIVTQTCKIADFGLSCPLGADADYYKASGGRIPVRWCAPECIGELILFCFSLFFFLSFPPYFLSFHFSAIKLRADVC